MRKKNCIFAEESINYLFMVFRLREIMEEKSISNVELSKMLDYTTVAISNMVTGKTFPSLKTLDKIAGLLGVPIWQFFVEPKEVQEVEKGMSVLICPKCGARLKVVEDD
jgi:DNA-binding XRE family transcriptional regulator